MDPLSAFSLACGIIQVVDFSAKLVSTAKQVYEDGSPKATKELADQTSRMSQMLSDLKRNQLSLSTTQNSEEGSEEIVVLANKCEETTEALLEQLHKMQISGPPNLLKAVGKSLNMWGRLKKVEKLSKDLDSYHRLIDTRYLMDLSTKLNRVTIEQEAGFKKLDQSHQALVKAFANGATSCKSLAEAISNNVDQQFQHREEEGERKTYEKDFLGGLFYPEITERERGIKRAHEETFRWIFEIPDETTRPWSNFADWLKSGSRIYWVSGKAGSGKSTLMGYIVRNPRTKELLTSWAGSEQRLLIPCFFFWKAGSPLLKSLAGFFRSIIFQILVEHPDLIRLVSKQHVAYPGYSQALTVWTEHDLRECFLELIQVISDSFRICLFVDGLDECSGDQKALLKLLEDLASRPNVKCCVSSRPERPFEHLTRNMLRLQDLNSLDISVYVEAKLGEVSQVQSLSVEVSSSVKERLKRTIIEKADGVFLWVELAVKSQINGLGNNDSLEVLEKRLQSLPTEIDDLYYEMLMRIDTVYREETAWYLGMISDLIDILDTIQPYHLRFVAVPTVINLALLKYGLTDSLHLSHGLVLPNVASKCSRVSERILVSCTGFVEIDDEPSYRPSSDEQLRSFESLHPELDRWTYRQVRFVHRSAKDFLDSQSQGGALLRSYRTFCKAKSLLPSAICLVRMTLCNQTDCLEYMRYYASHLMLCAGEVSLSSQDEISASMNLLRYFDKAVGDLYRQKKESLSSQWYQDWCIASDYQIMEYKNFQGQDFLIPLEYSPSDLTSVAAWFGIDWFLLEDLKGCSLTVERANQLAFCTVADTSSHSLDRYTGYWKIRRTQAIEVLKHLVQLGGNPNVGLLTSIWEQVLVKIYQLRLSTQPWIWRRAETELSDALIFQVFETFRKGGANASQVIYVPADLLLYDMGDSAACLAGFQINISRLPIVNILRNVPVFADKARCTENVKAPEETPLRFWLRHQVIVERANDVLSNNQQRSQIAADSPQSNSGSTEVRNRLYLIESEDTSIPEDNAYQGSSSLEPQTTVESNNGTSSASHSLLSKRELFDPYGRRVQEYMLSEVQASQFYGYLQQILDANIDTRDDIYRRLNIWLGESRSTFREC